MLNHITIMGRLVRDPELRHAGDTPVCTFRIACDRDYKNKDGEKETDFVDVVAWRKLAETVSQYFSKGRMAVVDGRLQLRSWTDKEGVKRIATEILANQVYFGDSKPKESGEGSHAPTSHNYGGYPGGGSSYTGGTEGSPNGGDFDDFVPVFDNSSSGELPF